MSASIGLSAASEKGREFPAFSTRRGNALCLRHVGDALHVGDGGYAPCLFGYVTMWVGASQSDTRQPIRTSVSETKEAVYRPIGGASWDEEQTNPIPNCKNLNDLCYLDLWPIDLEMVHNTSSPHGLYLCQLWIHNPWNRQWAIERTWHAGRMDRRSETNVPPTISLSRGIIILK